MKYVSLAACLTVLDREVRREHIPDGRDVNCDTVYLYIKRNLLFSSFVNSLPSHYSLKYGDVLDIRSLDCKWVFS